MPPTNAKKRKADDVGGPEVRDNRKSSKRKPPDDRPQPPSVPAVPQLPAPVWGHVLDYMPYQDVRSALLVCKMVANEAVKYVHTLSIMRSCERNVRAARRFSNVRHLHVLCLLERTGDGDRVMLSTDAVICLLPLASIFPRLKYLFAGCLVYDDQRDKNVFICYFEDDCVGPENHVEIMEGLISSFCGAFKTGLFPDCLDSVVGISTCAYECRPCLRRASDPDSCPFCTNVCSYLPLSDLTTPLSSSDFCLSWVQYYKLILQRPGSMLYATKNSDLLLNNFVVRLFCKGKFLGKAEDRKRLQQLFNHYRDEAFIHYIPDADLINAKAAWPYLCETLQFPKNNIIKCVIDLVCKYSEGACWTKSFVDRLVEIGFPVDLDKFSAILDENSTDPALLRVREAIASDDSEIRILD